MITYLIYDRWLEPSTEKAKIRVTGAAFKAAISPRVLHFRHGEASVIAWALRPLAINADRFDYAVWINLAGDCIRYMQCQEARQAGKARNRAPHFYYRVPSHSQLASAGVSRDARAADRRAPPRAVSSTKFSTAVCTKFSTHYSYFVRVHLTACGC
jgi:hypothetical protein